MKLHQLIFILALTASVALAQQNSTPSTDANKPLLDTNSPAPAPAAPSAALNATTAPPAAPEISDEVKQKLGKVMQDVMNDYNADQFDVALSKMDEADRLLPNNIELINFRGSILMRMQKWDLATAAFNNALTINPKFFPARFNLADVSYQQKKYADARALYQKITVDDPKNQLVNYRIYLTYLMEKNLDQAQQLLGKFDAFDDTPVYYFSQAAWSFNKGQNDAANDFINSAITIYPAIMNNLFAQPLIEAGWLKKAGGIPVGNAPGSKTASP